MEPRFEVLPNGDGTSIIYDNLKNKCAVDKSRHIRRFKKAADAARTCARLNAEHAAAAGGTTNQEGEGGEQNANSETATPQ